jgi:hypothetical protein
VCLSFLLYRPPLVGFIGDNALSRPFCRACPRRCLDESVVELKITYPIPPSLACLPNLSGYGRSLPRLLPISLHISPAFPYYTLNIALTLVRQRRVSGGNGWAGLRTSCGELRGRAANEDDRKEVGAGCRIPSGFAS